MPSQCSGNVVNYSMKSVKNSLLDIHIGRRYSYFPHGSTSMEQMLSEIRAFRNLSAFILLSKTGIWSAGMMSRWFHSGLSMSAASMFSRHLEKGNDSEQGQSAGPPGRCAFLRKQHGKDLDQMKLHLKDKVSGLARPAAHLIKTESKFCSVIEGGITKCFNREPGHHFPVGEDALQAVLARAGRFSRIGNS